MLLILQIMNYMILNLEYDQTEIEMVFNRLQSGETSLRDFEYAIGIELTERQRERVKHSLSKWRSALYVTQMRAKRVA